MNYNFSVNIEALYEELDFYDRFAAAKRDGFDFVEFWDWNNKNLDRVNEELQKNGLKMSTMSGDGPFSMCDPALKVPYLEHIKKSIAAAQKLNCPNLVVHSDTLAAWPQYAVPLSAEYSYESKICAMFDILRTIATWAEEAGVCFVLEALNVVKDHLGNFLQNTVVSCDLVKAVGSANVKILYDAYHMYLNEGKIVTTLEKCLDYIGYIHIADAPGRHEPGTGAIHYPKVYKTLEDLGYAAFVAFELYPQSSSESAIEGIKQSIAAAGLNN